MRSRASLVIIEQVVMLMVFALAAALCLKAFVWSDTRSAEIFARDKALLHAQSAAEVVKSCGGDLAAAAEILGGSADENGLTVNYDDYVLSVTPAEEELQYMSSARVCVYDDAQQITSLKIAWQEVDANE